MFKSSRVEPESDTLLSRNQIPIIDMSFGTEKCPEEKVMKELAVRLANAFQTKGMALLVNHGISEEKLKTANSYFHEFCDLSDDTKELYLLKAERGNHGYVKPGQERFDGLTKDIRHAYNFCAVKSQLPKEPLPGFYEHIAEVRKQFENLIGLLLQALAIGVEMPLNFFVEKHSLDGESENGSTFRLLYYPPLIIDDDVKDDEDEAHIKETDVNKTVTRCGAHCDYGTFTLLTQDSEGGLEVQLPNSDHWHRVGHLPGAVFINTAELLSIWTQGKYPALRHRVVIPENSDARSKGRHSIAYFLHPDGLTSIVPLETCAKFSSSTQENFKVCNAFEHLQMRLKGSYKS